MAPPETNASESDWARYADYIATEVYIRESSSGNRSIPAQCCDQAKNFVSTLRKNRKR